MVRPAAAYRSAETDTRCVEKPRGDTYITISDALYFLLKLEYEKLEEVDEHTLGCDVASVVATAFKKKLLLDIDDVNKIYGWGLVAALDGTRQYLTWMHKIWENKEDWPKVVFAYPTYMDFRKMLVEELGNLVRFTDSVFYLPGFLVSVVFGLDNINSSVVLVLYICSLFHGCE